MCAHACAFHSFSLFSVIHCNALNRLNTVSPHSGKQELSIHVIRTCTRKLVPTHYITRHMHVHYRAMRTNCAHHPTVCWQHYLRAYSNDKNWVSKKSTSVTNKTNRKWVSFKVLEHPQSCSWLESILFFLVLKEHMAVCVWLWFFFFFFACTTVY